MMSPYCNPWAVKWKQQLIELQSAILSLWVNLLSTLRPVQRISISFYLLENGEAETDSKNPWKPAYCPMYRQKN
jgi:hypothetical protein